MSSSFWLSDPESLLQPSTYSSQLYFSFLRLLTLAITLKKLEVLFDPVESSCQLRVQFSLHHFIASNCDQQSIKLVCIFLRFGNVFLPGGSVPTSRWPLSLVDSLLWICNLILLYRSSIRSTGRPN